MKTTIFARLVFASTLLATSFAVAQSATPEATGTFHGAAHATTGRAAVA